MNNPAIRRLALYPFGLAVATLAIGLLLNLNAALVIETSLAALSASLVFMRREWALPIFFAWLPFADLGKRLLWVAPEVAPSFLEYQWSLALPDIVLLAAVARLGYDLVRTRRLPFRYSRLDLPVGLFFVWSFLSIFNPANTLYAGLAGFKSSSMYILLYILVAVGDYSQTREWMRPLALIVIGGAFIAAVYAVVQVMVGFREFELDWLYSGLTALSGGAREGLGDTIGWFGVIRPFSTFASHEQLGWYLVFAIMLLLALPMRHWSRWTILVFLIAVLIRTLSRSAWAFAIVSIFLSFLLSFLLTKRQGARDLILGTVFAAAVFGLSLVGWTLTSSRIGADTAGTLDSSSIGGDTAGTLDGIQDAPPIESPFFRRATALGSYQWRIWTFQSLIEDPTWRKPFGHGTGSMWYAWRLDLPGAINPSDVEIRTLGLLGLPEGKRVLSHVGTVDIIYELGLVGFGLFFWIVVASLWLSLRYLKQNPDQRDGQLLIAMVSVMAGVVIANSTVATVLIFRPIAAPFWLAVGFIRNLTLNMDDSAAT